MVQANLWDHAAHASAGVAALSDSERLLITCLRRIARSAAEATRGMSERDTDRHIAEVIFDLIQSLGSVSGSFSRETERYLQQAIRRERSH